MRLMILLLFVASYSVAAEVYTWVDAAGVRHFGAYPPAGQAARSVSSNGLQLLGDEPKPSVSAPAAAPPPSADPRQKALDQQVKRQVAEDKVKLDKLCTELRSNLAQLRNNPRIRVERDGQVQRISEEERQQHISDTEKKLDEHCR